MYGYFECVYAHLGVHVFLLIYIRMSVWILDRFTHIYACMYFSSYTYV